MQTENRCVNCGHLNLIYNKKGEVIEKVCQGYVQNDSISTGMYVGNRYIYKDRKLAYEAFYNNDNFGLDYIIHKLYNNGTYKEVITNNFALYETDSIVLSKEEIAKRVRNRYDVKDRYTTICNN